MSTKKQKIFKTYIMIIANIGQSMHFIQAWKIFSTQSAEDISLLAYTICLILLLHWLAYGIFIKDRLIMTAETLGIIGSSLVIAGTIMYS